MGEFPSREEMSLVTLAKVREAIRALLAQLVEVEEMVLVALVPRIRGRGPAHPREGGQAMSRVYRWCQKCQTVEYTVTMLDAGEVDEETGGTMTAEEADVSAREWMRSAMPGEYYPESFVAVDEGPVEYLGMTLTCNPKGVSLSTEAEAKAAMGDGQRLVKMREIER
jgi:hypothetical protein